MAEGSHRQRIFPLPLQRHECLIHARIDGIDTAKPEGTYMLFLDCKGWCTAHNQTLEDLYKKGQSVGVYWQDGRPFHNEYGIRVNLALPKSRVEEALNRLRNYVFCD